MTIKNLINNTRQNKKDLTVFFGKEIDALKEKVAKLYGDKAANGFSSLNCSSYVVDPEGWATVITTEFAALKQFLPHFLNENDLIKEVAKVCNKKLNRNFNTIQLCVHDDFYKVISFLNSYREEDFTVSERKILEDYFKAFSKLDCRW